MQCDTFIKINSVKDLYIFVDTLNHFPGNIEIIADQYAIDAKSLMNMLSLDLSKPLQLTIDSDQTDDILHRIQPFILHEEPL